MEIAASSWRSRVVTADYAFFVPAFDNQDAFVHNLKMLYEINVASHSSVVAKIWTTQYEEAAARTSDTLLLQIVKVHQIKKLSVESGHEECFH
jgi:hypothetical protein